MLSVSKDLIQIILNQNTVNNKTILFYYNAYVTIEDSKYVKIDSVNPLYIMLNRINGYFEEINGNRYLTLVATNESKEKTKSMKKCGLKSKI